MSGLGARVKTPLVVGGWSEHIGRILKRWPSGVVGDQESVGAIGKRSCVSALLIRSANTGHDTPSSMQQSACDRRQRRQRSRRSSHIATIARVSCPCTNERCGSSRVHFGKDNPDFVKRSERQRDGASREIEKRKTHSHLPVSYTHLTLPTIYSV